MDLFINQGGEERLGEGDGTGWGRVGVGGKLGVGRVGVGGGLGESGGWRRAAVGGEWGVGGALESYDLMFESTSQSHLYPSQVPLVPWSMCCPNCLFSLFALLLVFVYFSCHLVIR